MGILVPSVETIRSKLPASSSGTLASNATFQSDLQSSLSELMEAGLHLGHTTRVWHPNMLPFIYGRRAGIHVINLEHTLTYLRRAMTITHDIARRGGIILFVGKRDFMKEIIVDAAQSAKQFYVQHWVQGCLANHSLTLKNAGDRVLQPDLIIVLDMNENVDCIQEATRLNIPTIGLADTDCDPDLVSYPIPGNDDSHASVRMVAQLLAKAAFAGKEEMLSAETMAGTMNRSRTTGKPSRRPRAARRMPSSQQSKTE